MGLMTPVRGRLQNVFGNYHTKAAKFASGKIGENCEFAWGTRSEPWAGERQKFPRMGIPMPRLTNRKAYDLGRRLPLDFRLAVEAGGYSLGDERSPLLINIHIFNLF